MIEPVCQKKSLWLIVLMMFLLLSNSLYGQSPPKNIWTSVGPDGGFVSSIAMSFQDSQIAYAGTRTGRIFKTTDAGVTWTPVINGLLLDPEAFLFSSFGLALAVDPADDKIVYAGGSAGLFKTVDGGLSWFSSSSGMGTQVIHDISINPLNPSTIYVGTGTGVYKSSNAGEGWVRVHTADPSPFAFFDNLEVVCVPGSPNIVFSAYINLAGPAGIYRSTDEGASWQLVNPSLTEIFDMEAANSAQFSIVAVDVSAGVFRSTDSGSSWQFSGSNVNGDSMATINEPTTVGFSPLNPSTIYVGDLVGQVFKSTDDGASWESADFGLQDAQSTDISIGGQRLYAASTRGAFRSDNGGANWVSVNAGLSANRVTHLASAQYDAGPTGESVIYAGITGGLYVSQSGGNSWELKTNFGLPEDSLITSTVSALSVDPTNSDSVYVAFSSEDGTGFSRGLFRSANGGATWSRIDGAAGLPQSLSVFDIVISTGSSNAVYVASDNIVYRKSDEQSIWTPVTVTPMGHVIKDLEININFDSAEDILFAATTDGIYRSVDNGSTWDQVDPFIVEAIAFNPFLPTPVVYAGTGQGEVLRNGNFGEPDFWVDITGTNELPGGPITSLHVDVSRGDVIFAVVSGFGVYKKSFFSSWKGLGNEGFTDPFLEDIVLDPTNGDRVFSSGYGGVSKLVQETELVPPAPSQSAGAVPVLDTTSIEVMVTNDGLKEIDTAFVELAGGPEFLTGIIPDFIGFKETVSFEMLFSPTERGGFNGLLKIFLGEFVFDPEAEKDSLVVTDSATVTLSGTGTAPIIEVPRLLSFGGIILNSSKSLQLNIRNGLAANPDDPFVDSLFVDSIFITGGDSIHFGLDTAQVEAGLELAPHETDAITVFFSPGESPGLKTAVLHLLTNVPFENEVLITVQGTGSTFDVADLQSQSATLGQQFTFDVTLDGLAGSNTTAKIFYQIPGQAGFKEEQLTKVAGQEGLFRTVIPAEDITKAGLWYILEVEDGISRIIFPPSGEFNPADLDISINSPGINSSGVLTTTGGTSARDFSMVSFPMQVNSTDPSSAFSASNLGTLGDEADWQLYRYDPQEERFIKATDNDFGSDQIKAGRGYLLITRQPKTLNSGAGSVTKRTEGFVQLEPRKWNLIANPFSVEVFWGNVIQASPIPTEFQQIRTFRNLVVLDKGKFQFVDDIADINTFKLEPWKAYFVYNPVLSADSSILNFTDAILDVSESVEKPFAESPPDEEALSEREFLVRLSATSERDNDLYNTFGQIHTASDGSEDAFDRTELPPSIGDFISLKILNPDAEGYLSKDIRKVSKSGQYWDFVVATSFRKELITITASGISSLPGDFGAWIVNLDNAQVTPVSATTEFHVLSRKGEVQKFRLVIGTERFLEDNLGAELLPKSFVLEQNYPNPFNPSTSIRFGLPADTRVSVEVFNLLGQRVATVVDEVRKAGYHTVVWDGRNGNGLNVGSGVYFYRIQTGRYSKTRKMILVR